MPFVPTLPAATIFAPTTGGGAPRGADMGETQTWGTEVEAGIDAVEDSAAANLAAERAERIEGDADLQDGIDAEEAARAAAVAAEAVLRAAGDAAMQAELDAAAAAFLTGQKPLIGSVRVITTANTSTTTAMEAGDVVDFVTLVAGDRVGKVYNGATGHSTNGIWIVQSSGAAVRATDANTDAELRNGAFYCDEGQYAGQLWAIKNTSTITVDTTAIVIEKVRDAIGYEAEVITARNGYAALDNRLDVMESGRIEDGDATRGLTLAADVAGKSLVLFDPVGIGPGIIRADRPPNIGPIHLIIVAGESLAAANTSVTVPAISTAPLLPYRFLMFSGCTLMGLDSTAVTAAMMREIVAAKETTNETVCTGIISQICDYEDRALRASPARVVINTGLGGGTYATTKKGTTPYANGVAAATELVAQFGAANVIVEAVFWIQGVNNASDSEATHTAYLNELYTDYNADLKAVTGQTRNIPIIMSGLPTHPTTGLGQGVQDAQRAVHELAFTSEANPQIFVGDTRYQYTYADAVHLNPLGCLYHGAGLGQGYALWRYKRFENVIRFTGATVSGSNIVVASNNTNLAVDDWYTADSQKGFVALDGATNKAISAVAASTSTILLTATSPAAGWTVRIGRTDMTATPVGPGGWVNVRRATLDYAAADRSLILHKWPLPRDLTVS